MVLPGGYVFFGSDPYLRVCNQIFSLKYFTYFFRFVSLVLSKFLGLFPIFVFLPKFSSWVRSRPIVE